VGIAELLGRSLTPDDDPEQLLDLIAHEYCLRQRAGESPELSEYVVRFPWLAQELEAQLGLQQLLGQGGAVEPTRGVVLRGADTASPPGYEIEEEVGRGGMGVVYRARQIALNRTVALKVVVGGSHNQPASLERLRVEAEAVARLQHPNVVQIFEVGEHGGCPFLALEYVDGSTVAREFAGMQQLLRRIAELGETLARAVDEVHRHGIVHRDLKPSNILLTVDGTPKIADFGLAKFFQEDDNDQTQSGTLVGTAPYMAPEQARGKAKSAGPAVDVYALGAILYELLTGRPPFKGQTSLDTIQQVLQLEPIPPSRLNAKVPRDLETVVLKCLEKDPSSRYTTAGGLADDLRRFLEDRPIRARRAGRAERAGRWCRRNPVLAALIASVAVLLLASTVASSVAAFRLREGQTHLRRALKAEQEAGKARLEADDALLRASLEQASADRQGRRPGSRAAGLLALAKVAASRPSRALRNQAITWMSQSDLELGRRWRAHPPDTTLIEFDPSLEFYARADDRGQIRVGRVADDFETLRLAAFRGPALRMLFGPDGRTLAAVGRPRHDEKSHLRVWDLVRGELRLDIPGIDTEALDFSADGRLIAAGQSDGLIVFHDLSSGHEVMRLRGARSPFSLAVDAEGQRIAVGYSQQPGLQVFALRTRQVVRSCPTLGGPRCQLTWHPSGRFLAAAPLDWTHDWDIHVVTIEPPDWPDMVFKGPGAPVHRLAFNHSGDLLAALANDGVLRLWSFPSAEALTSLPTDFFERGLGLRFSRDDRHLAAVIDGEDLALLNVIPNQACHEITYGHATHLTLSPDGRLLACADVPGVRIWDLEAGCLVASLTLPHVGKVGFTGNGEGLITMNLGKLREWRLERQPEGAGLARFILVREFDVRAHNFCLIEAGPTLAVMTPDDRILLFRLGKPAEVVELRHPGSNAIVLSGDGRWAATVKEGRPRAEVKLWKAERGSYLQDLTVASNMVTLAFSPDGQWLAVGNGREYRFLKTGSWEPGLIIPMEHRTNLFGPIAFAPDGTYFAIAMNNRTIRLVDAREGRELATLDNGNPAIVLTMEFSRDGRRLAVARWGHSVQVWDLPEVRRRLAEMGLNWDL
jgi:WD40 repeat protein